MTDQLDRLDLFGTLFQTSYATNDLEKAKSVFRQYFGVPEMYTTDVYELPLASNRFARIRIALAWAGSTQIELVEPSGGDDEMYRSILPRAGFALRHHHYCGRFASLGAFEAARQRFADEGCGIVMSRSSDQMHSFYTDTRSLLGHYMEYVWLADESMLTLGGRIPVYEGALAPLPSGRIA